MKMAHPSATCSHKLSRPIMLLAAALGLTLLTGCQLLSPPAVASDAKLGRVIIYRNGVAYFERYAEPEDEELKLTVPSERVDDLLKSLTIIDERTQKALPIRFPTLEHQGGEVTMTVKLPQGERGRLRITYVTESPAWKPSYRVILGEDGKATLHGWAIVDNVSGEDWLNVRVGVGSTSALSFRYDLHSVRLVQRQELHSGTLLAVAPPAGGTPYAVGGKQVRVLGSLHSADLIQLPPLPPPQPSELKPEELAGLPPAERFEKAAGSVGRLEEVKRRLSRQLDESRRQKDVVKTTCTNDKLTQIDVALRAAHEKLRALEQRQLKQEDVSHELAVLAVLARRVEQLEAEANQCIGHEMAYVGESSVTMEVDPQLTEEDPTDLPGWRKPISSMVKGPRPEPEPEPENKRAEPRLSSSEYVRGLLAKLKESRQRIRIEGFAAPGDADPAQTSLDHANAFRERLVAGGVPADRLEVAGTGVRRSDQAVRIVALEEPEGQPPEGAPPAGGGPALLGEGSAHETRPLGEAHFMSDETITLERDQSAMISILSAETEAERVYLYDPISSRGSKHFTFNALRFKNPSRYTLDSGPFTVYAAGRFLGEGLADAILPQSTAFIPYALDRSIIVDPELSTREEIESLRTIERGIVTTEARRIRRTKLTLTNRGDKDARVFIRHAPAEGYELRQAGLDGVEKLAGAYLIPVTVAAKQPLELVIEEHTPLSKEVDISTGSGIAAIGLFLKKGGAGLEAALRKKLAEIVAGAERTGEVQQRLELLASQMEVYRRRIDELNGQLVSLKQIKQAAKLRRHLAAKMEEISDKLQAATMELTDLKGQLMTQQIELQDKLSELSLARPADGDSGTGEMKAAAPSQAAR